MTSYTATTTSTTFYNDTTVSLPVTVPSQFIGMHNNSIGTGVYPVTTTALATASLTNGVLSVTVTRQGAGYSNGNTTQWWVAVVFSGGDPKTRQATGYPVINQTTGAITNIVITNPGDYQSIAPTVSIVTTGGPNIPALPSGIEAIRTHDYRGSGLVGNGHIRWYSIDPGDGSGNYNWAALDECILYHAGMGRKIFHTVYGTPVNYAQYPTVADSIYNNYNGGSSPLTATGLTLNTPNVGLWGFITALVTRYNVNASSLVNPVTGLHFPSGTRLIDTLEVWNEPTFGASGASIGQVSGYYWIGTASQLCDVARIINTAAKAVDPLIKIAGCGFISAYPMTYGTSNLNHFANFLTAVDSVQNKTGYQWLDEVSIHPYDALEQYSTAYMTNVTTDVKNQVVRAKLTMVQAGGAALPIVVSEWGFENVSSIFYNSTDPNYQAIQIKRVYVEHALLGLAGSYGYSLDSVYLGNPTRNVHTMAALTQVSTALTGKIITQVKRGIHGAILLTFSDGSTYFTG